MTADSLKFVGIIRLISIDDDLLSSTFLIKQNERITVDDRINYT